VGEEVRGASRVRIAAPDRPIDRDLQESEAKYKQSKSELDELVSNMEGL
jgi:hypothetical protein